MNKLETLRNYIPTGTTEGERHILDEAFVFDGAFTKAIAPPYGSPRLLVGHKGAGKTAILEYLRANLSEQGVPVSLLTPDKIDLSAAGTATDLGTIKRVAYGAVVAAVAVALAPRSGLVSGDAEVLARAAKASNSLDEDAVQTLLRILAPIGTAVTKIDFTRMLPTTVPQPHEVAKSIAGFLGKKDNAAFLLFDDTDQVASPGSPTYLPRIWGLLMACRMLAGDCRNLRCVITLRTEVWRRLRWDDTGQRDQLDHFDPLVVEWCPGDEMLYRIIDKRLELAAGKASNAYREFFDKPEVDLPGQGEQTRLWRDFLVKNSRERPRDAIQLIRKLANHAINNGRDTIRSSDAHDVLTEFSEERARYLAEEFAGDCPTLLNVIESLASLKFVVTGEELFGHLKTLPSSFSISIRGVVIQPGERSDALSLWALLHEAGFVNALVADDRKKRGFRHINHREEPRLVVPANWNRIAAMQWEVHPAFRSFLEKRRSDQAASMGISRSELLQRRRPTKRNRQRR